MVKDLVLVALPDWVDSDPTMYFHLGILYLAAVTRDAGYDVAVYDGRLGIKKLPPAKFYGFSCATPQITVAKKLAGQVNGQTIIGGPHPTLLPMDCMRHFDYVVAGEGEHVILDILSGKAKKGIITSERVKDLNSVPYPAWDMVQSPFSETLFPGERYGKGEKAATLLASRGCPHACAFCGNLYRVPVIYRSVESIIGEVKELVKRGVRHLRFEDDNITLHPQLGALCLELKNLDIRFKAHTRSDFITYAKAMMLQEAGCEEMGLGVESADGRVLKLMNKRETAQDHLNAIRILHDVGLRAKTYWITGLPGETSETIELNKAFVRESQIDKWTVSTFSPYPGCAVFKSPGLFGVEIVNKDWSKWWNFTGGDYVHVLQGQTLEEMKARYKDFYGYLRSDEWRRK